MTKEESIEFRARLLKWYDSHRRVLPWRALPGQTPDPYHVWLSEIMLQQTTVQAVIPYFLKFLDKWPTVQSLSNADPQNVMNAWAGLGYYARARNLLKCAQVITNDYNGIFPKAQIELKTLPGIGDYTSAAIASIAFNLPANVVDGNVERVMARYFNITEELPAAKKTLKSLARNLSEGYFDRPGDYAQSLMDLGATICTPKSPLCSLCPIKETCQGYKNGTPETLPRRATKAQKPQKIGYAYIITNDRNELLLEKRPGKGLLGGMLGLPTSLWVDKASDDNPLHPEILSDIQHLTRKQVTARHSFTHFDLELFIFEGKLNVTSLNDNFFWYPNHKKPPDFPTVFKKVYKLV